MNIQKYLGTNWKTTLAGISAILGALADIIHGISAQQPIKWDLNITAIIAGIGLLMAKDSSVHSTSQEVKAADIEKKN